MPVYYSSFRSRLKWGARVMGSLDGQQKICETLGLESQRDEGRVWAPLIAQRGNFWAFYLFIIIINNNF